MSRIDRWNLGVAKSNERTFSRKESVAFGRMSYLKLPEAVKLLPSNHSGHGTILMDGSRWDTQIRIRWLRTGVDCAT
jgi:hypothetical protein